MEGVWEMIRRSVLSGLPDARLPVQGLALGGGLVVWSCLGCLRTSATGTRPSVAFQTVRVGGWI